MPASQRARWLANLALLLVAIVWGSAFVAQRMAMEHVGPFAFGAARFGLGGLVLLPGLAWRCRRAARPSPQPSPSQGRGSQPPPPAKAGPKNPPLKATPAPSSLLAGGLALGALLFGGASLQQIGMVYTTAGKGGFITGLYIVIVPALLALVWRKPVGWSCWLGVSLATLGLFLLSTQAGFRLAAGDGWVLASAFVWALHVIAVGRLAPAQDALRLAVIQYGVCALLSALAALACEPGTWPGLLAAWPAVAYTGVLSIGLGYTTQVIAQRHTPPTHTAILLSLESVFAALGGWLVLGEMMSPRMLLGAGLMLAGTLAALRQ